MPAGLVVVPSGRLLASDVHGSKLLLSAVGAHGIYSEAHDGKRQRTGQMWRREVFPCLLGGSEAGTTRVATGGYHRRAGSAMGECRRRSAIVAERGDAEFYGRVCCSQITGTNITRWV
jgi:hypothetical protein